VVIVSAAIFSMMARYGYFSPPQNVVVRNGEVVYYTHITNWFYLTPETEVIKGPAETKVPGDSKVSYRVPWSYVNQGVAIVGYFDGPLGMYGSPEEMVDAKCAPNTIMSASKNNEQWCPLSLTGFVFETVNIKR
jgi:hypothetical protein